MIHSARPTVPDAISEHCFHFVLLDFEKWGRTDGWMTCAKTMICLDCWKEVRVDQY